MNGASRGCKGTFGTQLDSSQSREVLSLINACYLLLTDIPPICRMRTLSNSKYFGRINPPSFSEAKVCDLDGHLRPVQHKPQMCAGHSSGAV